MSTLPPSRFALIRSIYLYLVCLIGLLMVAFSSADLVNIGLRTWVFPKADLNEYKEPPCATMYGPELATKETEAVTRDRIKACEDARIPPEEARAIRTQREAVRDISYVLVGIPLLASHWWIIRRDRKKNNA
ncbi:MAG: hypothetical protein WCV84_01700 [Patescibacteria group bacterium]